MIILYFYCKFNYLKIFKNSSILPGTTNLYAYETPEFTLLRTTSLHPLLLLYNI